MDRRQQLSISAKNQSSKSRPGAGLGGMNLDEDSDVEQFDRDTDQVSSQAPNPKLLHNQPKPREFSGLKKHEQFKRSDSDDSDGSFGQQI